MFSDIPYYFRHSVHFERKKGILGLGQGVYQRRNEITKSSSISLREEND